MRRVWPWNGHWGTRGSERLVVERGSVIATRDVSMKPGPGFLGLHREIGCGRVLAGPAILGGDIFCAEEAHAVSIPATPDKEETGEAPLFALLAARRGMASHARIRREAAQRGLKALGQCYDRAADFAGETPGFVGPGPTQWSKVRTAVSSGDIKEALFGKNGVARPGDADWGAATGRGQDFTRWLRDQIEDAQGDSDRIAMIAKGAAEAVAGLRDTGEWSIRL